MRTTIKLIIGGLALLWMGLLNISNTRHGLEKAENFEQNRVVVEGLVSEQRESTFVRKRKYGQEERYQVYDVMTTFRLPDGSSGLRAFRRSDRLPQPSEGGPIRVKVAYLPENPVDSAVLVESETEGGSQSSEYALGRYSIAIVTLLAAVVCLGLGLHRERARLARFFGRRAQA